MVLKTAFRLTKERALKTRRLAEYQALEERRPVDTEKTLNQLVVYAFQLIEEEKRQKARAARQGA